MLCLTNSNHLPIGRAGQTLSARSGVVRRYVVHSASSIPMYALTGTLQARPASVSSVGPRGQVDVPLPGHLGAVRDAGANVCLGEVVLGHDFLALHAAGQQVKHERHPDPPPSDTRLAEADLWVDGDAFEQLFSRHGTPAFPSPPEADRADGIRLVFSTAILLCPVYRTTGRAPIPSPPCPGVATCRKGISQKMEIFCNDKRCVASYTVLVQ